MIYACVCIYVLHQSAPPQGIGEYASFMRIFEFIRFFNAPCLHI